MRIDDISGRDINRMKSRILNEIDSMDESELRIVMKSERSLTFFIAQAFQSVAKLLGYAIALPIAFATNLVKQLTKGFSDGWKSAWDNYG